MAGIWLYVMGKLGHFWNPKARQSAPFAKRFGIFNFFGLQLFCPSINNRPSTIFNRFIQYPTFVAKTITN